MRGPGSGLAPCLRTGDADPRSGWPSEARALSLSLPLPLSLSLRRREYTPNSHAFLGPQRATVIQLAGKKSVWEQCVCLFLYMSVCERCTCLSVRVFLCESLCVCVWGEKGLIYIVLHVFQRRFRLMLLNQVSLVCAVVITGLKDAQIPIHNNKHTQLQASARVYVCVCVGKRV